jgi:RNA polymerase sigma-70 factor, ECF subfamily
MPMPTATVPPARERQLLAAARRGDEDAYRRLVEPHRRELHAHCYRMLGSVHDADDAVQDAMLRAWRGLHGFEGRSTTRSWLYKVTTNACLTAIERRPRRTLPLDASPTGDPEGAPLAETVWLEPYPDEAVEAAAAVPHARYDQREGLELALVAALQHLPANQRAALILREVLGFSAREVADLLDTSVPAVNSALQRARKAVDERLPDASQQATLRRLGDERLREIVETYVDAWERGDVDAVAAMLAEDATLTMPPMATWYRGVGDVLVFLTEWAFSGRVYNAEGDRRVRVIPTRANGQPAFGTYSWDRDRGTHLPTVLQVLTLRGGRIEEITGFVDPAVFGRFGLPAEVPA